MMTPFGTGFVEKQLEKRLGLPCEIEGLFWAPWCGLEVNELRFLPIDASAQALPLIRIEKIALNPAWSQLLRGRKRWDRLEFQNVELNVSLEALRDLLSRYEVKTGRQPVERESAANQPRVADVDDGFSDKPDRVLDPDEGNEAGDTEATGMTGESKPVDDFEGEVVFSEVSMRVYSNRLPGFDVQIQGLKGEIPLWGAAREGVVSLRQLSIGGRFIEESVTIPVKWKDRTVGLDAWKAKMFGIDLELSLVVRVAPGLPLGVQLTVPDQQIDLSFLYLAKKSPLEIDSLGSVNRLQGFLLVPGSFRGTSATRFQDLIFHDLMDGGDTHFKRGRAFVTLSAAGLIAKDIHAIGDDDAVLMNGFATMGGEAAATVRVVSSPERADILEGRVRRAGPHCMDFKQLVTPDRQFRDIRVELRTGGLMMNLGKDREWVPFFESLGRIVGRQNYELPRVK